MDKTTYDKSVNILLDAYNEGRLFHGECNACAVGNLLGTRIWGCEFVTSEKVQKPAGKKFFSDFSKYIIRETGVDYSEKSLTQIKKELGELYKEKGYTRKELAQIEYAFEMALYDTPEGYIYWTDRWPKEGQYKGLVAVLTLMETMVEEPVDSGIGRLKVIAHDKYQVIV